MGKSFFREFEDATLMKLELMEHFLEEWIRVFTNDPYYKSQEIFILDLFAGKGRDSKNRNGSPLIILSKLTKICNKIREDKIKLTFILNEYNQNNYNELTNNISLFFDQCKKENCTCPQATPKCYPFDVIIKNEDFQNYFNSEVYPFFSKKPLPAFIFIDQFGIKYVSEEIFLKLTEFKKADVLFFISSNFIKRFADNQEFQKFLGIKKESFKESEPEHCHRVVVEYYRELIKTSNKEYYIAPFSLKKKNQKNYYGLVFGSNNLMGLEKFLKSAWKLDQYTGEASYDIDNDAVRNNQLNMFENNDSTKKDIKFKSDIEKFLLTPRTNREIYEFTLVNGFLPKHTKEFLKQLNSCNRLRVSSLDSNIDKPRQNSFYIEYKPKKNISIQLQQ